MPRGTPFRQRSQQTCDSIHTSPTGCSVGKSATMLMKWQVLVDDEIFGMICSENGGKNRTLSAVWSVCALPPSWNRTKFATFRAENYGLWGLPRGRGRSKLAISSKLLVKQGILWVLVSEGSGKSLSPLTPVELPQEWLSGQKKMRFWKKIQVPNKWDRIGGCGVCPYIGGWREVSNEKFTDQDRYLRNSSPPTVDWRERISKKNPREAVANTKLWI